MNKSKSLPTYILVANIQDLFWNNNSDLYPSCAPDPSLYTRIDKHFPVFHSPYLGTIILTGEYNHCIYNGVYYFLNKLRVLDVPTEQYEYQLDYDVMMNFLVSGVEVRGTLIKTNREDILEDCLQHTVPILSDPINIKVYNGNKTKKWQDDLELILPNEDQVKNFKESISYDQISKEDLDFFVNRINNSVLGKITKDKEWKSNKVQRDQLSPYQLVSPLFIVDYLPTIKYESIWKTELALRLFTFLGKEYTNLVVTKQNTPSGHFNEGRYILGKANSGLGTNITEEVSIPKIDLSGLRDIVPLNYLDGSPANPNITPKYEHLISSDIGAQPINNVFIGLRRKAYLPINNGTDNNESCIDKPADTAANYRDEQLWNGELPQKVETFDNEVGYLWYLDKNNVPLVRKDGKGRLTNGYKLASAQYWSTSAQETWWQFWELEYKNIPPLGFILFQLYRPRDSWEDIEFVGTVTDTLSYRTGLDTRKFIKYVNNDISKWWSTASPSMLRLWGSDSFSRLNLDLDYFTWMTIAPSDTATDQQFYKWYRYSDWWGYLQYFPQYTGRTRFYPSQINKGDITYRDQKIVNQLTNDTAGQYLREREIKLNQVSIYEKVKLDKPITKGTIVTTSLEHYWGSIKDIETALPFTLSSSEILRILGAEYNHDLFKGDYDLAKLRKNIETTTATKEVLRAMTSPLGYLVRDLLRSAGIIRKPLDWYTASNLDEVTSYLTLDSFYNKTPQTLKDGIVVYLYKGEYRIGKYEEILNGDMSLSSDQNNIVKLVDGKKGKQFTTYVIRPITEKLDFNNNPVISEADIRNKIVEAAMGTKGGKIHRYDWDDLKVGTQTFDLVGTSWNLIVHNGTINLFPKDGANVIIPMEKNDTHKFSISSNEEISTYAKINQKSEFNYYGQVFPLNTKFSFNRDSFTCTITSVEIDQEYADPDVEFKRISVNTANDQIEVMATLPKKQTRAAGQVDAAQVLLMKERLIQQTMNYEQDKYASQLMLEDKRLLMARQREDITFQRNADLISGLLAVGGAGAWGAKRAGSGTDSAALGYLSKFGTAYAALGQIKPAIISTIRHPTLLKRVDEDERNLLLANSQQLYQRKQNYEHDFKIQTYKLNKIANSFVKPAVSNRDAQEQFNKLRKIENVNIHVYLPSTEQLIQINHIYSTYGCECIWNKFTEDNPLVIENGMKPGLYRFSKLNIGGLLSKITDNTLREILRQILENGTKFELCNHKVINRGESTHITASGVKIDFDTDNINTWTREKWAIYTYETDPKEINKTLKEKPHYGLTDEEWEQNKKQLTHIDDETLLDRINQIISGRETGRTVVIEVPKEIDPEKERLQETINGLLNQITNLQEEINTNKQICEADKQQLDEEKRALQVQLTQCQQQHTDLTKEKEGKEGQITIIQGKVDSLMVEKLELEKQINECREQIKRLLAAQQTCDRINTAEIKRLKDELEKTKKARQELQTRYQAINQQLKTAQQEKNRAQKDLATCNTRLTNKQTELDGIKAQLDALQGQLSGRPTQDIVNDLQSQLAAKNKELQDLQKLCDDEKTKLEETKKNLEDEIHKHKVDKEDLTQQLNDERRRAINEKDEINKLKKQIEDSKQDKDKITELEEKIEELNLEKASCDERIAAKHRELEQCRTELDLAKKAQPKEKDPSKYANVCTELKAVLHEPYAYDTKTRENGWNAFLDLIFELAQNLKWEGITDIDQKLTNVREIRPVLEKLEELKNIPIIDKAIDTVKTTGWSSYLNWLEKGGELNGSVDGIITKVNEIKLMETTPTIHAVKALLDELNWLSYKAKDQLTEQLKTNQDLQTLFHHIYPGTRTIDLYKTLYGDPNTAIIRKRFTEDVQCVAGGTGNALETLVNYVRNTSHSIGDITKPDKPQGGSSQTTEDSVKPKPKPPTKLPTIPTTTIRVLDNVVVDLEDTSISRQVRNIIANFNEAVKGTWASSEKPDWLWTIYNYPYNRYLKATEAPGWKGAPWNNNGYYKLVWVHHKNGNITNKGRYFIPRSTTQLQHREIAKTVVDLWNRRDEITINREWLQKIRNGEFNLKIAVNETPTASYRATSVIQKIRPECLADLDYLGLLEDFIKMLYIFHKNRLQWSIKGKDYSDNYSVYGIHEMRHSADISEYKDIGKTSVEYIIYQGQNDPTFFVGWVMPSDTYPNESGKWVGVSNTEFNSPRYTSDNAVYRFVRWFYEVAKGKRPMEHPWKIDGGGAYAFLEALYEISTT